MATSPLFNVLRPFFRARRRLTPDRRRPPLLLETLESRDLPAGTWTALTNLAPSNAGTMMLLTDGTIMMQGGGTTNTWYKLTAGSSSGYVNGTWSQLASMSTQRLYTGSAVLPNGNVFVIGGEYSGPAGAQNFSNTSEIYNPVTNSWTTTAPFPLSGFGDDPVQVLANGKILAGYFDGPDTYIYNPSTNTWSYAATKLRNDQTDEETWVKLPDGSILSYDIFSSINTGVGHAQRYIPSSNTWVDAGTVPVALSMASAPNSSSFYELGPAFLLPDGRVFQIGGNSNTAFYTPSTNTWTAGPTIPNGKGADDAPGVILPNGHVIFAGDTPYNQTPTQLFEFDPVANTITQMTLPTALSNVLNSNAVFVDRMVGLPDGTLLFGDGTTQLWDYNPNASATAGSQPTITSVVSNGGLTYTLTGTQLNGISEGSSYGDDVQNATNYPIVRLTNGGGTVFTAPTFNWTSQVATDGTPVTAQFTLPAGLPVGSYSLTVVANGISSAPFSFYAPLSVVSSTPANGSVVSTPPTSFVVTFNEAVNPGSFSASALQVNGISATGVSLSSGNTVATFTYGTSPVTAQGGESMTIAANAITGVDSSTNTAFSASFRYDALTLAVTSTNPSVGSVITIPVAGNTLTYNVNFNMPIDPATASASNLIVSQGTVTGVAVQSGNTTVAYTIAGLVDGPLNVSIPAGQVEDQFDNPGFTPFSGSYTVDITTRPFPALTGVLAAGSQVYNANLSDLIQFNGDTDKFTVAADPGQTLTVVVTPTGGSTPLLYGAVGFGSGSTKGQILLLNQTNGAGSFIGQPVNTGLTGLVYDPSSGFLLGSTITGNGSTSNLVEINPTTGALVATIGAIKDGALGPAMSIDDLAIQPGTNILYGIRAGADGTGHRGYLYTINKTTGVATFVGDTGAGAGGGISFAPDGSLWQTAFNNSNQNFTSLNKLNPTNAARISTLSISGYYDGLAIRPTDGTFFATNGGSNNSMYTINPTTGAVTFVGGTGGGSASDLAFGPYSTLTPTLQISDPSSTVLGSTTAAGAGQSALLQSIATTTGGTYTISVGGAGGSTGNYTVQVSTNSALEAANQGIGSNKTRSTAQNLNPSFLTDQTSLASASQAAVVGGVSVTSVSITAADSGWWDSTGFHNSGNKNYFVGQSGNQYRDYFVFNLAGVASGFTGAQLQISNPSGGYSSPFASDTYSLFDVSTSISALESSNSGQVGIFNDLGSGVGYGNTTVSNANNGQFVFTPLNASALAALNSTVGGQFAFGGTITSIVDGNNQSLFGGSGDNFETKQLVLSYADNDFYSLTLQAGQKATVGLKNLTGSGAAVTIQDSNGNTLASGVAGSTNLDQVISNFTASSTGTYYVVVSDQTAAATYSLTVTRNAAFDTEPNGAFASAADVTGTAGAVGAIMPTPTGISDAVVPAIYTNTESNSGNAYPFNLSQFGIASMRYQQIYSPGDLGTGGPIDAIRFRRSSGQGTFTSTPINISISLGYAATTVTTASPTFANNIGTGGLVNVYSGTLVLSSTAASSTPQAFDVLINLMHNFNYDPSRGSLLLDFSIFNSPGTNFFLAATPDPSSQTSTTRIFSFDVNASSGNVGFFGSDTAPYGLITRFDYASSAVVPGIYANTETNNGNGYPFTLAPSNVPSMRYQQIYAASDLGSGGLIDALRFRRASGQAPFTTSSINVSISLAYAATTVTTASPTFANNIGTGGLVNVYSGTLVLSSTAADSTPEVFDIVINLMHNFNYNPAQGSLLLDISIFNSPSAAGNNAYLEAADNGQNSTTRIFSFDVAATTGNVGVFGTNTAPYGLVTRFDYVTPAQHDWYKVTLNSTQTALQVETSTPLGGPNLPLNLLNPQIQLFDSTNTLIASGTLLADGRNQSLLATGLTPGATYYVEVTSANGNTGEFFLGVAPLQTPVVTVTVDDTGWGFRAAGPGWVVVPGVGYGTGEHTHAAVAGGTDYAQWQYGENVTAGTPYAIFATWVAAPGNATNATYTIYDGATPIATVTVDQTRSPNTGLVGSTLVQQIYTYTPTTTGYHVIRLVLTDNANGTVIADAVFDPPLAAEESAPLYGPAIHAAPARDADAPPVLALTPAAGPPPVVVSNGSPVPLDGPARTTTVSAPSALALTSAVGPPPALASSGPPVPLFPVVSGPLLAQRPPQLAMSFIAPDPDWTSPAAIPGNGDSSAPGLATRDALFSAYVERPGTGADTTSAPDEIARILADWDEGRPDWLVSPTAGADAALEGAMPEPSVGRGPWEDSEADDRGA